MGDKESCRGIKSFINYFEILLKHSSKNLLNKILYLSENIQEYHKMSWFVCNAQFKFTCMVALHSCIDAKMHSKIMLNDSAIKIIYPKCLIFTVAAIEK